MSLDCRTCSKAQRIERGCEQDSPIPGKWRIEGEVYNRCPNKLITRQSNEYLDAYDLLQTGLGLPYGDGWIKHSKKFLDAIHIIHAEILKRKQKYYILTNKQ